MQVIMVYLTEFACRWNQLQRNCVKVERESEMSEWVTKWRVTKPFRHYHSSRTKSDESLGQSQFLQFHLPNLNPSLSLARSLLLHLISFFYINCHCRSSQLLLFSFWSVHFPSAVAIPEAARFFCLDCVLHVILLLSLTKYSTHSVCALFGFQK